MGMIRQRAEGHVGPKALWHGCTLLLLSCVVQAAFSAPVLGGNSQWYAGMEFTHPLAGISLHTLLLGATFLAGISALRLAWLIVFVAIAAMVVSGFRFDYEMHHPYHANPLATIIWGSLFALGSVAITFWISRSRWWHGLNSAGKSKPERLVALSSFLGAPLLTLFELDQLRYGESHSIKEVMLRVSGAASLSLAGWALLSRIKGQKPWHDVSPTSLILLLLLIINADLLFFAPWPWRKHLAPFVIVLIVIVGLVRSRYSTIRLVGGALSLCAATIVLFNPVYEYYGWVSYDRVLELYLTLLSGLLLCVAWYAIAPIVLLLRSRPSAGTSPRVVKEK